MLGICSQARLLSLNYYLIIINVLLIFFIFNTLGERDIVLLLNYLVTITIIDVLLLLGYFYHFVTTNFNILQIDKNDNLIIFFLLYIYTSKRINISREYNFLTKN